MDMKDLRVALFRMPSGYSADLLAMKRYMNVKAACDTSIPAKALSMDGHDGKLVIL